MKNFTNNFKQFTSRLSARWLIMALMLLLGTSSAWGWNQSNVELFFDNSTSKWTNCYVYIGKDDYTSCYALTRVTGTQYLWKLDKGFNSGKSWDGATGWVVSKEKWWDGNGENIYKFVYHGNNNVTNIKTSAWDATTIYKADGTTNVNHYSTNCTVYNFSTSTKSDYTVTINSPTGGTLTVKDYDNNTVSNGASKIGLTVLKFSAAASTGYTFKEVQIYNGSSTTTISAANIDQTYTVTSNVTITPVWTANQYTISYKDKGNVTFTGTHASGYPTKHTYGTATTLDSPTKPGYTFGGWFTKSDCSGTPVVSLGATAYTANITLYALWELACVNVEVPNITSDSPICLGSELTLTLKDRQDGVTYNIGNQEIFTGGNNTYSFTPQTTGSASLTVVASHEKACNGATNQIVIDYTVNALPSAPILTTGSTNVCPGTLTLANFKAMAEQNTVVWYSNEECTQVVTTPTVEKGGTYKFYAKSKNASGCFSEGYSTLEVKVYDEPADFTLTAIPAEICSGADVVISISNKQDGVTYKLGEEIIDEIIKVNPTDDTEYTVTAYLNACPTLIRSKSTGVITVHPIPSFTVDPTNLSLCKGSTSETDLTVLSHVEVANGDPVWYDAETAGNVVTEGADLIKGGTYWVAAENVETGCINPERKAFTITIHDLPKYPDITKPSAAVCQEANATVSLNELAEISDVIWYQGEDEVLKPDAISIADAGTFTYTAKAVNINGCQSATGVDFILTVNPLPTINIGEDVTAVLYEDVVLTATGNNIADVTWIADKGTITKDPTDPKKAVLTYNQPGDVIVTAKAISAADCESAEVSKKVTFGEETCKPTTITVPANYIEIYCKYNDAPTQHDMKVDIWKESEGQGTESYQSCSKSVDGYAYWKFNITDDAKYCIRISNKEINYKSGSMCTLTRGHKYYFDIPGGWSGWTGGPDKSKTQDITETQDGPPAITTPAVKMLSAYSEEGSGELRMTAQIVKTGCNGNMTYYFKYRLKGAQEWSLTAAQTATGLKAGDEINATVTGLNQGGTYEIQAVINNNNEAVSNILEYVVNIEETAISDVTLQFANANGDVLQNQNQIYCVGSTAYIKLSYRGTAHKSLEWIAENELQPVNGKDKLYSYVVRGNETITANVANDANEGTPATGTIDIKVYTIATTPDISIDRTEVCSADQVGAKITVKAPQEGITYQAYKMVGDVETTHGEAVVADNAESIIINSIKETGTYYVKAWNAQCPDAIAVSLSKFAVTKIDASSNTIAISPETASTNPWMPVTVKVDKNSAYDYTLVCKQRETDVTDQMVINKKGDSYVIKFPKPESATIDGAGQVVFDNITYSVIVSLNGNVECGVTSATSTVTLTNLIEDCD